MRVVSRALPLLMVITLLGFASPIVTLGAESPARTDLPSLVLQPADMNQAYFSATIAPGDAQTFTVLLGNTGGELVSVRTFAADAYSLPNGGFGASAAGEVATGTTTWVDYLDQTLDLAPGAIDTRTFTVSVPNDAAPGQYITALVLQTAQPVAVHGSKMLSQILRKAIAVLITTPGPISPMLTIGRIKIHRAQTTDDLVVAVNNPGNVLLRPAGSLTVTTEAGESVLSAPISMGSVFAGMSTTIDVPMPVPFAAGDYIVTVDLADQATGAHAVKTFAPLTVTDPHAEDNPAPAVTIEKMTAELIEMAAGSGVPFVAIDVAILNTGPLIAGAQLTMHVTRDGAMVEDLALNSSLAAPTGRTEIQQRYVPLPTWTPGTYQFSVTLQAIDAISGQVTNLATAEAAAPVTVP